MSVSKLVISSLPFLLQGASTSLLLWFGSAIGALALGLVLALLRLLGNRVVGGGVKLYLSIFRGTPLLIQLMIFYYGLTTFHILLKPMQAAYLGLILHFAAYLAEAFRSAIGAIEVGQWEAARSLGMSRLLTLRRIILPQALRVALPPIGNSLIDLVKSTSVASVIQVSELTRRSDEISAGALVVMPMLLVAAAMYWVMTAILAWAQERVEQALALPGA
jgi:cystine transport system permease protein